MTILNQLIEISDIKDFPHPKNALMDPDGLLGYGFILNSDLLIKAYQSGIFPWFEEGQPVLWWSPKMRAILEPCKIHISRSLSKILKKDDYSVTMNMHFDKVIYECAHTKRQNQDATWITQEMINAYQQLHSFEKAQSIEVWREDKLIGGLYGVTVNGIFCGESMFSHASNASKIALVYLAKYAQKLNILLIDCQIMNPYLKSMGAEQISRSSFLSLIKNYQSEKIHFRQFQMGRI